MAQIHYNNRPCYFSAHDTCIKAMPLSQVDPSNYHEQLDIKVKKIREQFSCFEPPALEVFDSAPLNYRMRAEFKIWHEGNDSFYVMFKADSPKKPHRIDDFVIGSSIITNLMPMIMSEVKKRRLLREKLFQCEFLTTLSGQALVTLIYHKKLDDNWLNIAKTLETQLNIRVIGRSRKQKLVLSEAFVTETLNVCGQLFHFQQVESGFTQPNAGVNQKMLGWALKQTKGIGNDLVELYCGNGNFTVVLAQNFNRVLATEISKTSVRSALYNFDLNNIHNVQVARMSSEEFSSALLGSRTFRRLAEIDLESYHFSTVLVDPPRAGLDENTTDLISRFDNIIYISCNPSTLHDNLNSICKSHSIEHFALFDQFPYTDHIECGVMLKRKKNEL